VINSREFPHPGIKISCPGVGEINLNKESLSYEQEIKFGRCFAINGENHLPFHNLDTNQMVHHLQHIFHPNRDN
jgi:hypothetical protein